MLGVHRIVIRPPRPDIGDPDLLLGKRRDRRYTEPVTDLVLEAPAGLIRVRATCEQGKVTGVTFRTVPAFATHLDAVVEVPHLAKLQEGQATRLGGIISKVQPKTTKQGKPMAIATLEDLDGSVEVLVFPDAYAKCSMHLKVDAAVFVCGTVNLREDKPKIFADQILPLDDVPRRFTKAVHIRLPAETAEGHSLLPLVQGKGAGFTGGEYAYIDRLPWWEAVLGGWHLEHQSEREAQYTPLELEKIKGYRTLLNETIGGGKYPPECIAIRTNEWKLILREHRELLETVSWWNFISDQRFAVAGVELYDLVRDPREQKNVANEYPAVVETLRAKLLAWDATNPRSKTVTGTAKPTQLIPYP